MFENIKYVTAANGFKKLCLLNKTQNVLTNYFWDNIYG